MNFIKQLQIIKPLSRGTSLITLYVSPSQNNV